MRQKPTCPKCQAKFTRKGNMLRHMQDIHGRSTLRRGTLTSIPRNHSFDSELGKEAIVEKNSTFTEFDKHLERISLLTKLSAEYTKSSNYIQTLNSLRNKLAFREKEIQDICSNNWMIPLKEIQGLNGFVCRRCNLIVFTPVRYIGYDMTTQRSHKCDEGKVKGIKMVSIRKPDVRDKDNFLVSRMMEFLKFCMPDFRYLITDDISGMFSTFENTFSKEIAKMMFGVPNRRFFYSVKKDEVKDWIKRMLKEVGTKTILEESQIRELLLMVKSTYGILEIPDNDILRRVMFSLTP